MYPQESVSEIQPIKEAAAKLVAGVVLAHMYEETKHNIANETHFADETRIWPCIMSVEVDCLEYSMQHTPDKCATALLFASLLAMASCL